MKRDERYLDISGSLEPLPIPIKGLSVHQASNLTETFHTYVSDSVFPDGTAPDGRVEDGVGFWGCQCVGLGSRCEVADSDACDCVSSHGNFYTAIDTSNRVLNLVALPPKLPLVECGSHCSCAATCSNRLTQRGVCIPMTISPTSTGLGIFYTPPQPTFLPKGSFISLYAGEYLTTDEARARWASNRCSSESGEGNYILSLRLPSETIHIDPRHIGNIGRFLNHSCDPNCIIEVVKWGAESPARAAIFTKRVVHDREELTFDYGDASGQGVSEQQPGLSGAPDGEDETRTRCLCGTSRCRGFMPFDETL